MDEVSSGYQSDTSGSLPSKYFPPETGAVGLSGMTQLKTVLNEKVGDFCIVMIVIDGVHYNTTISF